MNRTILTGRVTRPLELRYTKSEVPVSKFILAVTRDFKNSNGEYETDFISCIAYRQTAKLLNEYVEKGDKIGIEGRLQTGCYEKDDKKIYTTDVLVERVEFLQSKSSNIDNTSQNDNADFTPDVSISDDELPF